MKKLLGIDAASKMPSIVVSDGENFKSKMLKDPYNLASNLVIEIENLMDEAKLATSDLDCVIAAVGPGSFTGIRIGIAAQKGIALPHNLPIFGVSNFLLQAFPYKKDAEEKNLLSVIVSGNNYYSMEFDSNLKVLDDPQITNLEEISEYEDLIISNEKIKEVESLTFDGKKIGKNMVGISEFENLLEANVQPMYVKPHYAEGKS